MKRALQIVLSIALVGAGFSGVLSYLELFAQSGLTCPSPGQPGTIFGYPACVYGFLMYLAVSVFASWGLLAGRHVHGKSRRHTPAHAS